MKTKSILMIATATLFPLAGFAQSPPPPPPVPPPGVPRAKCSAQSAIAP